MWNDPIVREVHNIREKHAQLFNYDLEKIYQDIKKAERESGKSFIRITPNKNKEIDKESNKN